MILTESQIHDIIAQCWSSIERIEAMSLEDPPVPQSLRFRHSQNPVAPKVVYLGAMIRSNLEIIVRLTDVMEMQPF